MAFVNEYISKEDIEKYDLQRICGEHNLPNRGVMHSRTWTIDRDRDAFLIKVWSHRDSDFEGWAFFLKSNWVFFEVTIKEHIDNPANDSCWSLYLIRKLLIPSQLEQARNNLITDLRDAFSAYSGGGVFGSRMNRSATVEFCEE